MSKYYPSRAVLSSLLDKNSGKKWALHLSVVILLIVVLIGLYSVNHQFSSANPGGTDFIPRWLGTRLLLTEGLNPYSSEVSLRIQDFISGRPSEIGEDQHLFVYPLYSILFFSPFALFEDFTAARALWMTWLEIALVIIVFLSIKLSDYKASPIVFGLLTLFALFWYHDLRSLINGNPAILCTFFLTVGLTAIKYERDILAGIFLGFATVKPQIVVLVIPFVLLWAYSHRRWHLIIATISSVVGLVFLALLIEPNWIIQNFEQITAYPDYTLPGTLTEIFQVWWPNLGGLFALVLTLVLVAILIWLLVISWKAPFRVFILAAIAILAITTLIGIQTATANYVVLLPGVIIVSLALLAQEKGCAPFAALLFSGILFVGVWTLFLLTREGRHQSEALFLPAPLMLIIFTVILLRQNQRSHSVTD